jgi:adenylate kinase
MSGFSVLPNILITGTPGTGKTQTATLVLEKLTGFKHLNVGDIVKQYDCYQEKDEEFDSLILDDDKLLDTMEPMLAGGGCIVDFHSAELFPERWFELVLVLRAETTILFDRLTERGYSEKKRNENIECEIFQIVLEEAKESYNPDIVHEMQSNTIEEMESNVDRVAAWYSAWEANNSS